MVGKGSSKGEQRRANILNMLKQNGRITVQEIVGRFACSEATARRDLDLLEKTEPIIRTIGGALYDGFSATREISFTERKHYSWIEKEAIAEKAASLIGEGDIIGLTGGTTTFLIARALKTRRGITVVTNAVNIAMELADNDEIQIVVIGGIMRNKSFELCGPLAEKMVDSLNIGKMFIGIDGISLQGVTTYSESEAEIAKALIKRSGQTYAVFDHSKVGKSSLFSIAPLSSLHACITDAKNMGAELHEQLVKLGVKQYLVDSSGKREGSV
ncbi:HTH-type transcriptional repressor glcR [Chlamydia abortus]|uniref:DeoR/GlpR family DNA-binding transcription regulator n=1 Tax=Paenibacillus residui TaxID=629724 RepID=A0ABW3D6R5_9BACL|nr:MULTISPECIES: DeoR/GlpR family DNA-binding transcription regulator [Paenibacillaceae]SHE14014.1 HTH-type transcriptional repressor glcR [Chlamydia abortus]